MTKAQLDMLTAYYSILQDGCSKEQALSYILLMKFDAKDVVWLVEKVK